MMGNVPDGARFVLGCVAAASPMDQRRMRPGEGEEQMTNRDETENGQAADQNPQPARQPKQPAHASGQPPASRETTQAEPAKRPDARPREDETPDEWLREHSLGNPGETGNTITGENEY
jgi:hypothetical protein